MEQNIIDEADKISQLPRDTIHHILSFLDCPKTHVGMSVLSKHWFDLITSLKFDMKKNISTNIWFYDVQSVKDTFFNYVDYTTSKFCELNVRPHTFSIVTLTQDMFTRNPLEPTEVDILDRCLGLILRKGVRVLEIDIYHDHRPPVYRLPDIRESASSLTSMTIRGCEVPPSFTVKFNSLKCLSLSRVPIDERVIRCLTTSSPLLEEFNIEHCYGFKRFCVLGHQNLKKVQIHSKNGIRKVYIKAPNLCYLFINNYKGREAPSMNLVSCRKLTTLCYNGFLSERFTKSLSKIPVIENLFLCLPSHCDNLKLLSHSLSCPSEDLTYPFLTEDSSQSKAFMKYDSSKLVDNLWFQKLRRFLDKNNGFKFLELVFKKNCIDFEEFKLLPSPPYVLDHVQLEPEDIVKLPFLVAVVDAVLWCCRPQCLTLKLDVLTDFKTRTDIVKYTHEKLHQQEDQGQINIRVVLWDRYGCKYPFRDLNSMLKALTNNYLPKTITFVKEKGISEAAAG